MYGEYINHKAMVKSELEAIKACTNQISGDQRAQTGSYAAAAASSSFQSSSRALDMQSQEVRNYWQFRKCAKIHSIDGETDAELWRSLQQFLRIKLRIPTSELSESDITSVRRMRMGRGKWPKGEVVVVFRDVETRDRVCSYARNLAPFVDAANKPTAGVRMYVPAHLGGIHKTLLQYGHNMRERHGPEFKRNIRFEDAKHTLCIDIRLPGPSSKWVSISYEHVLADRRAWSHNIEMQNQVLLSSQLIPISTDTRASTPSTCFLSAPQLVAPGQSTLLGTLSTTRMSMSSGTGAQFKQVSAAAESTWGQKHT